MKKLGILALVTALVISTGAMALDITYGSGVGTGAKDENGVLLEGIINPVTFFGEYLGVNPLVLLLKVVGDQDPGSCVDDDEVLDATTIGAGRFFTPFNGEWEKQADIAVQLGDEIYIRLFNNSEECLECGGNSTYWTQTAPVAIHTVSGGTPDDYKYWFPGLQTDTQCIPEPTILLSGLALLLLRRKR
jgi:hypothetical protein